MPWTIADIPDRTGATALVTGSNTGLGLETATALAGAGARVVLACRDTGKAGAARDQIEQRIPDAEVEVLRLDLGSLAQIADAAAETRERFPVLDLLVNNAGVMIPPRSTTEDGFELQFGTNHLGHFAFTGQVLPSVLAADAARVVVVSSLAHQSGRIRWDDLQWERFYERFLAYGQSKLANLLFMFELQRRFRGADLPASALAAHPGVSATELARHVPGANLPGLRFVVDATFRAVGQPASKGALPTLRAATDPTATGGQYFGPSGVGESRGDPVVVTPMRHALVEEDWARLWAVSEELTGVEFSFSTTK